MLYYNKAAFAEAGLDPEKPPANWAEHAAYAEKLTKRSGDSVQRWGVQIPATGFTYWLFQALVVDLHAGEPGDHLGGSGMAKTAWLVRHGAGMAPARQSSAQLAANGGLRGGARAARFP